jgi:adenylate kinase family enzyme
MRRVLIIGSPGAGKSTFARQLGRRINAPVIHLDKLYWQPGWIEPDPQTWSDTLARAVQAESWIMDGHYGSTLDLRLQAADTVILLDFPRSLCLRRVFLRVLRTWGRNREDMGPGCREKVDFEFIRFIWNFNRENLPAAKEKLQHFTGGKYILKSPRELQHFLAEILKRPGNV